MTASIHVTGTDFVTVFVKDFPAASDFYENTLGLRCSSRYDRIPGAEFETGNLTLQVMDAAAIGREFQPRTHPLALESQGVTFFGETIDSGVCLMAPFADPDGNVLMIHNRYAPKS
jgi:catechol 2,3-dioxygenase-like lactoylglutathione lyase family enzyme